MQHGVPDDVAIVGAGAAGAAAACALAPHARVALIERDANPPWRIGETLPGAAGRLLRAIGAWESFAAAGHPAAPIRVSRWGSDTPETLDAFRDPDGAGWRLDRARFERDLRAQAQHRGARLVAGASVSRLTREAGRWRLALSDDTTIEARYLIDATGRQSRLLRDHGQVRRDFDRLACAYQLVDGCAAQDPTIYTQATAEGWWYCAHIGAGPKLVAFFCDADLPAIRDALHAGVLQRAMQVEGLRKAIGAVDFDKVLPSRMCLASSIARSSAGEGWLSVGDAAISFDPLSSQGLFNALATGVQAAQTLLPVLGGASEAEARRAYAAGIGDIWRAYAGHLQLHYRMESRWPLAPFWSRRR